MRTRVGILIGASAAALATGASAQDAQTSAAATPRTESRASDTTGVPPGDAAAALPPADIIVTARRREERLQDVPQTVDVVTGNTLQKLNLQRFEDVQALVPGLTLTNGNNGFSTAATIRGASFQVELNSTPTVEFYLNDALVQSIFLFQSVFDIGQIEVLRGPQGTLRGRSSPSGSITITTRRPDLERFGGYFDSTGTNRGINFNGAFNVPIVKDLLAIRIAGIVDHNDANLVRSINNGDHPYSNTEAGRISARLTPASNLEANVTYQRLDRHLRSFDQVESFSLVDGTQPVVQPIIKASDRRGITDGSRKSEQKQDLVTGQVNWHVAGQQLSYVGSYSRGRITARAPQDVADVFKKYEFFQTTDTLSRQQTHELRLASEERLFGAIDYTIGGFYSDYKADSDVLQASAITLNGARIFTINTPVAVRSQQREVSGFVNLTWHIGDRTELSGGARHISFRDTTDFALSGNTLLDRTRKTTPTVYNVSLSHRFSDQLLGYVTTGSSWRSGPFVIGAFRPLTPRLTNFLDLKPETSKSYEAGLKATLFDKRLLFDVSGFHQTFHNFLYRSSPVYYLNQSLVNGVFVNTPALFNFGANVPAVVNGFDINSTYKFSRDFNIGAAFSYAKGHIRNGAIPCNDINGDGVPDATVTTPTVAQILASAGGEAVAQCRVKDRLSFAPNWSLTVQSEYARPISDHTDVFLRGLLTYYPHNVNDPENRYDNIKAYGLANVYFGLRAPNGAWELSVFAKNIANTQRVLTRSASPVATSVQALNPQTFTVSGSALPSSYLGVTYTQPRYVGVNLRYAFGSR